MASKRTFLAEQQGSLEGPGSPLRSGETSQGLVGPEDRASCRTGLFLKDMASGLWRLPLASILPPHPGRG